VDFGEFNIRRRGGHKPSTLTAPRHRGGGVGNPVLRCFLHLKQNVRLTLSRPTRLRSRANKPCVSSHQMRLFIVTRCAVPHCPLKILNMPSLTIVAAGVDTFDRLT